MSAVSRFRAPKHAPKGFSEGGQFTGPKSLLHSVIRELLERVGDGPAPTKPAKHQGPAMARFESARRIPTLSTPPTPAPKPAAKKVAAAAKAGPFSLKATTTALRTAGADSASIAATLKPLTVVQLRQVAADFHLKGVSKLQRAKLIDLLAHHVRSGSNMASVGGGTPIKKAVAKATKSAAAAKAVGAKATKPQVAKPKPQAKEPAGPDVRVVSAGEDYATVYVGQEGIGSVQKTGNGSWYASPPSGGKMSGTLLAGPHDTQQDAVDALVAVMPDPKAKDSSGSTAPGSTVMSPPAEAKFEVLADTGSSGDGYAAGGQWGIYGAAGVLIRTHGIDGQARYLLVQRGPGVSGNKGKWQLPGGALNSKETPYNAAARETIEEVGAPLSYVQGMTPVAEHVYTHEPTGWKYTTIAADSDAMFEPIVDGSETSQAGWFTQAEIEAMQADGQLVPKLDKSLLPIIHGAYAGQAAGAPPAPSPEEVISLADIEDMAHDGLYNIPLAYGVNPKNGRPLRIIAWEDAGEPIFDMHEQQPDGTWDEGFLSGAPTVRDLVAGRRFGAVQWYGSGIDPASLPKSSKVVLSTVPDPVTGSPTQVSTAFIDGVKIGTVEASYFNSEHKATAADGTYLGLFPNQQAAVAALASPTPKASSVYDPVDSLPAGATKAPPTIVSAAAGGWDTDPPAGWTGAVPPAVRRVKVPPEGKLSKQAFDYYFDNIRFGTVEQLHGAWEARDPNGTSLGLVSSQSKAVQMLVDRYDHVNSLIANGQQAAVGAHAAAQAQSASKQAAAAARDRIDADVAHLVRTPDPTDAEKAVYSGDFTGLRRVGPQGGSNEGGVFEAADGSRWYVKAQQSAAHAGNEALAVDFYREAGIDAPEVHIGQGTPGLSGTSHTATRILETADSALKARINGNSKGAAADRRFIRRAHEGFAVDAWLANWDVAGQNYDNIVVVDGRPIRIDSGGSLLYRAQGQPKGDAFGADVIEWDTYTDKQSTRTVSALHDTITRDDMLASAKRVQAITPAKIRTMVKARGLGPSLATLLIERRKDIISRAKAEAAKPSRPFGDGALTDSDAKHSIPLTLDGSFKSTLQSYGLTALDAVAAFESMASYKGSGYKPINKYLYGRGPGSAAHSGKTAADHVRDMDIAFEHSALTQDIIVYQGSRGPARLFPKGEWSLVGGMDGKEFTVPAYWSSSVDKHTAEGFAAGYSGGGGVDTAQATVMRIVVPKGTAVIDLQTEGEVLFNRGLRYRVVKDYGVDYKGVRRLDVEVI